MTKVKHEKHHEPGHGLTNAVDLRQRAEQVAGGGRFRDFSSIPIDQARLLLHELHVHQIELELQNEELRQSQLALENMRALYFDLFELAPIGYVMLSESALILEANLRASSILGLSRSEVVSLPLTRFIYPEDQDIFYRFRKKLLDTSRPQVCELRIKQQDDTPIWVQLTASPLEDAANNPLKWRATLSDITESRALQMKLAQTDRMACMGILAAGVAHEINNPLTYMLFHIESLSTTFPRLAGLLEKCRDALQERVEHESLEDILGEDLRLIDPTVLADGTERLGQLAEGTRRIKEIAEGLTFFSRVDSEKLTMVDLNHALEQALKVATSEINCRAELVRDLGQVPPILGSDGRLAQLFLNLVTNAAQSIVEGNVKNNRITVRSWHDGKHVFAAVTDTGCGIPPGDLEKIFEPFYTTKSPDRGTGLGLAVVSRIVSELEGHMQVTSTLHEGTRVQVQFPVRQVDAAEALPVVAALPEVRGRIMVVDDEPIILKTLSQILGREHEVVPIGSGRVAIEVLQADACFDLILCDLMMPDVSGIEVHAWLAIHEPMLAERLVFISGGAFTAGSKEYLARVPNLQINKPFSAVALRQVVRQRIIEARGATPVNETPGPG